MASRSTRKSAAPKATTPEPEDTEAGEEGVRVTGLHETHAAYIKDNFGVDVDPLAVALIYKSRVAFRKSDEYEAYLAQKDEEAEAAAAEKEQERADRAKAKADAAAAKELDDDADDAPAKPARRGRKPAAASTDDSDTAKPTAPRRGRRVPAAASADDVTPPARPARARRGTRPAAEPAF